MQWFANTVFCHIYFNLFISQQIVLSLFIQNMSYNMKIAD